MAGALMYPAFVEAVGADPSPFTFLGIAVPVFSYADSVFPVILGVGLLAIVYHLIDRFIPDVLKMVLVPMLSLVISVPLTLLVFAPLVPTAVWHWQTASSGCSACWGLSPVSCWASLCR